MNLDTKIKGLFEIKTDLIKDLTWQQHKAMRSGVIPYTVVKENGHETVKFCLGEDAQYGEYTDFGGGVKKIDRSAVNGGLRELSEEALGVFGGLCEHDVGHHYAVHCANMMIMFVYFDVDPAVIVKNFAVALTKATNPEISSIIWVNEQTLIRSILGIEKGLKLYARPRNLLYGAINMIKEL